MLSNINSYLLFLIVVIWGVLGSRERNGYPKEKISVPDIDTLEVDGSWKEFYYTNSGSYSKPRFVFSTAGIAFVQMTELYCAGDNFGLYEFNSLLAVSPFVNATCNFNTPDPNVAFANPIWSSRQVVIGAGSHNITIQAAYSPFTAGRGAIRVRSSV